MALFIFDSLSRTTAHSTGGQPGEAIISQACRLNKARWDLSDALEGKEKERERSLENPFGRERYQCDLERTQSTQIPQLNKASAKRPINLIRV